MCFVSELIENDLNSMFKSNAEFTEKQVVRIVYNTLCSLSFLHETNVIHRNFKASSILINSDNDVKITGFKSSRTLPHLIVDSSVHNSMNTREEVSRK